MVAKRAAADQLDPAFMSEIDFPIVKRGFDPASVQAFAAAVGVEMSRLLEENRGLQAQVAALKARASAEPPVEVIAPVAPVVVVAAPAPPPAPTPPPAPPAPVPAPAPAIAPSVLDMWGSETNRLLETARENVAHVMAQAEAEARGIVAKAELDAEKIRRSAVEEGERQSQAMRDQTASDLARAAQERDQIAEATRRSRIELASLEQDKRSISTNLQTVKDAVLHALSAMDNSSDVLSYASSVPGTVAPIMPSTSYRAATTAPAPVFQPAPTPVAAPAPVPVPPTTPAPAPVPPAPPVPERFVPPPAPIIGKLS